MNFRELAIALAHPLHFNNIELQGTFAYLMSSHPAELAAYRENPNCANCRANLIRIFQQDIQMAQALIQLINPKDELTQTSAIQPAIQRPQAAGRVVTIEDSVKAYEMFVTHLNTVEKAIYKGFSVCRLEPGKLNIYIY